MTSFADIGVGSLREAIDHANHTPGEDTITFKSGGTIKLMTPLPPITDDLVISAIKPVTLYGHGKVQILQIAGDGTDVSLTGLKLTGGLAAVGGALLIDAPNGNIYLAHSVLSGNKAVGSDSMSAKGGAIANLHGTLNIDSCLITGNVAFSAITDAAGGALYNLDTVTISGPTSTSKATIFSGNSAMGMAAIGGAIYNGKTGKFILESSVLSGNTAEGIKGLSGANGVKGANGSNSPDADTVAGDGQDGTSGGDGGVGGHANGGAIANQGDFKILSSIISGNTAAGGKGGNGGNGGKGGNAGAGEAYGRIGPGYNGQGGNGGNAGKDGHGGAAGGGGISNSNVGVITISDSEISANTAKNGATGKVGKPGSGGAGTKGPSKANDGHGSGGLGWISGFPGSPAYGGGIENMGNLSIQGSTVTKNQAIGGVASFGGGVNNAGTLSIDDSTISFNAVKSNNGINGVKGHNAPTGYNGHDGHDGFNGGSALGGGIFNFSTANVQNSTVSGNTVHSGNGGNGGKGGSGGPGVAHQYYGGSGGNGGNGARAGDAGGGGIFTGTGTTLVVEGTTISGNSVIAGKPGRGGAGGPAGHGPTGTNQGVHGSKGIAGGLSRGDGGGIATLKASLTLTLDTISENIASAKGGGVSADTNSFSSITNSSITDNQASQGGGLFTLLDADNHPVDLISTIIAGNRANLDADISGPVNLA